MASNVSKKVQLTIQAEEVAGVGQVALVFRIRMTPPEDNRRPESADKPDSVPVNQGVIISLG